MAQAQKTQSAPNIETPAPLKPGELKGLFQTYENKHKAVKAAEAALEKAMSERSKAVEAIAEHGKAFTYNGERLIVMSRTAKESGAKSFFFRGEGDRSAIEVA